jgi:ubiquinone/menaquinone biosynthesis C-methylase UbiE
MKVDDTRRTYDRIAARYAARDVYPMKQELAAFLTHLPEGSLVADIGCGTGEYAQMMTARGYRVIGLDLSTGMLVQAHNKGVRSLLQADMRRLPLASRSVRGCFLSASLLHLPRTQASRALSELRRVLQETGIAFLSVKAGDGSAWMPEPEGVARYFVYYQPAVFDQLLLTAGFIVVEGWISPPSREQTHRWIARVVRKVQQ